ncbi:MAG TPA: phosphodiester glycosidase family protein [Acidimicrobiales bacterium]|nr:phosphodiester glycosidase family protein [Acidimicrobiales bacterium]
MTGPRVAPLRRALRVLVLVAGLAAATLASCSRPERPTGPVPAGFDVVRQDRIDTGVEHLRLRRRFPPQEAQVARISGPARPRLRTVLAGTALAGPAGGAPTSALCARSKCAVAVNGDFADPAGRPVGAAVSAGELVTTPGPEPSMTQLNLDAQGRPSIGALRWSVELQTGGGHRLAVGSVNRPLADRPVLYTSRWGATTGTDAATVELVVGLNAGGDAALPSGVTTARLLDLRAGGTAPILPRTVVLAARGAAVAELVELWRGALATTGAGATLHVSTGGAVESVGGSPRLLPSGPFERAGPEAAPFVLDRHPRTMVGITATGEVLLVAVDGRQPGRSGGLALAEAASVLAGLGATEGINLDGGGSTTFVVGGRVSNRPSEPPGERPVPSALVVLPDGGDNR